MSEIWHQINGKKIIWWDGPGYEAIQCRIFADPDVGISVVPIGDDVERYFSEYPKNQIFVVCLEKYKGLNPFVMTLWIREFNIFASVLAKTLETNGILSSSILDARATDPTIEAGEGDTCPFSGDDQ